MTAEQARSIRHLQFRAKDVVRLTGMAYRNLDYWDRVGLFVPSVQEADGIGTNRIYSFEDLVKARAILALRGAGVEMARVREMLKEGLERTADIGWASALYVEIRVTVDRIREDLKAKL